MSHRIAINTFAAGALFLALSSSTALAAEPQAVAERLKVLLEAQGMTIDWTGIAPQGDGFVLQGVTVGSPGVDDSRAIGDVTATGVSEDDEGYRIEELALPANSYEAEGTTVELGAISITEVTLPAEGSSSPYASFLLYETAVIDSVTATANGTEFFSLSNFVTEVEGLDGDGPMTFTSSVESFDADLSLVEDANTRATMDSLGFATLSGSSEMAGSYNPTDGRMSIDQWDINLDEAGTMGFTFDISGYTPAFITSLTAMQSQAEGATEEQQAQQGLMMLGLLQQLNLHSATIRFDDDTLTQKVLDHFARQQGSRPADVANQAKAMLPFVLAYLNNPELTQSISAAVGRFLDDPRSLEIRVEPENPLPFAMIAASATTAPQSLPQQLRLSVTSND